ncbi:TetR/AcrR family transcriptional regulator [Fodinicola acaciae]|uniref:TetR/AcrR family transcriptional regulator n=1 Tax=Fodinicola acaciae TaxID=2681555 RepID=UPI0013D1A8C4|nr:TetR family transcriptional regulator [Fodinicola acaciae]
MTGLRELKKARTKAEIQRQAVRLFADQGYAETTMEQIAAAAEVSPSTVFRYFATKEDLVAFGDFAPLIELFQSQPAQLPPLAALRVAFRTAFASHTSPELLDSQLALVVAVPELWAASLATITARMDLLATAIAHRTGDDADSAEVRTITGAALGVFLAVAFAKRRQPKLDIAAALDESFALLANSDHADRTTAGEPPVD